MFFVAGGETLFIDIRHMHQHNKGTSKSIFVGEIRLLWSIYFKTAFKLRRTSEVNSTRKFKFEY
jgi:hypothetical protein